MVHDKVLRWENLPLNSNRHYIAKYNKVILTGKEGNGLGKEIIEKHDSLKRQRRLEELDVDRKSNSVLYSFEHNSDVIFFSLYYIFKFRVFSMNI